MHYKHDTMRVIDSYNGSQEFGKVYIKPQRSSRFGMSVTSCLIYDLETAVKKRDSDH